MKGKLWFECAYDRSGRILLGVAAGAYLGGRALLAFPSVAPSDELTFAVAPTNVVYESFVGSTTLAATTVGDTSTWTV